MENKVGATRRNLFVPIPRIYDIEHYDTRLLDLCMECSEKSHYAKGESERAVFVEDVLALRKPPEDAFEVVGYSHVRCDKYGYVCLDGNHRYAADPAFAKRTVIVCRRAFDIYTEDGELICTHKRAYGKAPSTSDDPLSQLNVLCIKPAGWKNSQVRYSLPQDLRHAMDEMDKAQLADALRCLRSVADDTGYDTAVRAIDECVNLLGEVDRSSVEVMASCIAGDHKNIVYDDPVDLDVYDAVYSRRGDGDDMSC